MSRESKPTKHVTARRRLVLATFVVAIVAVSAGLALAQDAEKGHGTNSGHAPVGHSPTTGTAAPPGAGDHGETGGAQSGEHRGDPAEHGEHAGGHHELEDINWTDISDKKRPAFFALVVNFGLLMTLYYMLARKPVTEALKQRRITIGKDIDEAQKLLDEAKERAKKYQGDLKNADTDAATAKASLISAGKGEVDRLILEAQERADRMKRDADRLVDQERKQVHQDLLRETVELAVTEAKQLLEKTATADDHARLAQDLLAELARRPAAARSGPAAGSIRPPGGPAAGGAT